MGLSRNKVAVSEGAAGSPPFYGDTDMLSRTCRIVSRQKTKTDAREMHELRKSSLKCCSILKDQTFLGSVEQARASLRNRQDRKRPVTLKPNNPLWGCSSAGRAPALQAGGHGFDSHHLHQDDENLETWSNNGL